MRVRLPLALAVLSGAFLIQVASADPVGRHVEFTPMGGGTLLDGDQKVNGSALRDELYIGGRLGYQLHPSWTLEAAGGYSPTGQLSGNPPLDVDFLHFSGNVLYSPWSGLIGGPFLTAGFGTTQIKPSVGESQNQGGIEAGGGLRFWLTDALGLRLEMRAINYKHDDPVDGKLSITHLVAGGGVVFAFGAKGRDTDGDGVPDRKDKCADTPHGARVDETGCPKDGDGDAVFDGLDQCEGTPKGCTVDARGCQSDADGDGVCDGLDTCADTPKGASVNAQGCPGDADGDGVFDGIDTCPDTPKGATVNAQGCPTDADSDGVPDGIDKCPDTSVGLKVDATGCPVEYLEKETELLDTGMIRLQNVNFETGKAALLPESYATLDVVGAVLSKWPELKIEVGGHTDSRGSTASNQKLSESRAQAVLEYLTRKYPDLKADQYSAKGYGEGRALVPNTTDLNMAKNRRVEFVVQNKDVLKHETERRRLLQKNESAPADTTKH